MYVGGPYPSLCACLCSCLDVHVCVCIPYVRVSMPALLLIRAHPSSHTSLHNSLHVYVYHRLSTGVHILLLQRQPSLSGGGNVTGEDNVKNGISRTGSVISPSLSLSLSLSLILSFSGQARFTRGYRTQNYCLLVVVRRDVWVYVWVCTCHFLCVNCMCE